MLFIKFLKQQLTTTYAKLTVLGKLLLTLQIALMFVPIIDTNVDYDKEWRLFLLLIFFAISAAVCISVTLYLIVAYRSFIIGNYNKLISNKEFLKLTIIPFTILATISATLSFTTSKLTIIQLVLAVPITITICGYIANWLDDLPDIKLPKFNFKKLFIKDVTHD